jgi:hypothetical protein
VKKQRKYGHYKFRRIGTFISDNLILLKKYPDGSKICIETAQEKLPNGQFVPAPPYLLRIIFPITMTQEKKIKLLRKADNLAKSIPKELIASTETTLTKPNNLPIPKWLYVKTYCDLKKASGKAALKKDYLKMKTWVKKRYRQLLKDPSLSQYNIRYEKIAKELVGKKFGNVVIDKELSTERIKSIIYSKA